MRFSRCHPPHTFLCAALFSAIGLAGCGNSCFVGFSNNGNGGVIVKVGNPPPPCSLSQAHATMSVAALASPVCETCATAGRVEHVFVTLRSVQLHPGAGDGTIPPDWLELAPQLGKAPRQIDLMGNSMPVILAEGAIVPAGIYREVRLQLFSGSPASSQELPAENPCGETGWNCKVTGDGHVEPLRLPGGVPELLLPSLGIDSPLLVVLPDARMELRLSLEPHPGFYFLSAEGWKPQNVLLGRATIVQQRAVEAENSTPD
jgi:hypothetical protein